MSLIYHSAISTLDLWLVINDAKEMPKIALHVLCPGLKKYHYIINSDL
jgi:hypothetical protein